MSLNNRQMTVVQLEQCAKHSEQAGAVASVNDAHKIYKTITFCVLLSVLSTAHPQSSDSSSNTPVATPAEAPSIPKANPAIQRISLAVPVRKDRYFLGEAEIDVAMDGSALRINAKQLASLFTGRINQASEDGLLLAADSDGLIGIEQALQHGVVMQFDTALVEVQVNTMASARASSSLSLIAPPSLKGDSESSGREPKGVSAYMNITGFSRGAQNSNGNYSLSNPSLNLDAAVHIASLGHVTLEGSGSVDADGDANRGGVRAVLVDSDNRWQLRLGDVGLGGISYMANAAILGAEFNSQTTRTTRRNTVSRNDERSFFLERPATARLIINGRESRRFELEPGPYTISDFPLADGANDVVFIIEDDTGEIDRIEFSVFTDLSLLPPGQSEYALSAGVGTEGRNSSTSANRGFQYDGPTIVSGYFERGLALNVAGALGLQVSSEERSLLTASLDTGTRIGRFNSSIAASHRAGDNDVTGTAARINWASPRLRVFEEGQRSPASMALSLQYLSRTFGSIFDSASNNDNAWRFNMSYSQQLFDNWPVSLGVGYNRNRANTDTQQFSISTGRSVGPWSLSAQAIYQRDVDNDILTNDDVDDEEQWRVGLNARYAIDRRSSASASMALPDESIRLAYSRSSRNQGIGSWNYSLGTTVDENQDVQVTGSGLYLANRFTASASQSANVQRLDNDTRNVRGSFRLASSLAWADGKLALGRPINDSFLILYPHRSLEERSVEALSGPGNNTSVIARSGVMGPALVPGLSNRGTSAIAYDVNELPTGYDLGSGFVAVSPRYRSGFSEQIGSAYTITVIGNMVDEFGYPLSVTPGIAQSVKDPSVEVELFSNRRGRFGAQGLASGQWIITMQTQDPLIYRIDIPEDTVGLWRSGTLNPVDDTQ